MSRRRAPLRLAGALCAAALSVGALLSACSFEERIVDGVEDALTDGPFYAVPTSFPAAEPGSVFRSEPIPEAPDGTKAWRVIYHSEDVDGGDVLVSGVVVSPDRKAPEGGWPIISWGHPTTGISAGCAPSLGIDPFDLIEGLSRFVTEGYVVAATDYQGMGVQGQSNYLIGEPSGKDVLDAARAARGIRGADAGDELLLWGHSQGGHAVLFAASAAADYAPELRLVAAAAAAPATDLATLLDDDIGTVSGVTIASYAFEAYSTAYGPTVPGADLERILTPAGAAATPKMAELCLFAQNGTLHRLAEPLVDAYLAGDPASTQPWASLLRQNSAPAAIPVPVLIAQGESDTLVRPETTRAYAGAACGAGTALRYLSIPGAGHGDVAVRALPDVTAWFADARAGESQNECANLPR